jgi:hypothetical protein
VNTTVPALRCLPRPTAPACPPWCDRLHGPRQRIHTVDLGEVELPSDAALGVGVDQIDDDRSPLVSLTLFAAEETIAIGLSVREALVLRALLTAATELAGGAR